VEKLIEGRSIVTSAIPLGLPTHAPYGQAPTNWGTVCVMGVPRGGTTMISGLLSIIGIDMGKFKNEDNQEDLAFISHGGRREVFTEVSLEKERASYVTDVSTYISNRNLNGRWGWKDPISSYYINDIRHLLNTPCYIIIVRDVVAVAERERLTEQPTEVEAYYAYMHQALKEYERMILKSQKEKVVLFVSYERALRYPMETVAAVCKFLHILVPSKLANEAADYISADRRTGQRTPSVSGAPGTSGSVVDLLFDLQQNLGREFRERAIDVQKLTGGIQPLPLHELQNAAEKAIDLLNQGDLDAAEALARSGLFNLAIVEPVAAVPQRFTEGLINSGDLNLDPKHAPTLIILNYVLGIVLLQRDQPKVAIGHLSLCYTLSARALLQHTQSTWPGQLIWTALFHKAFAAKMLGNGPTMQETIENMKAHAVSLLAVQSNNAQELRNLLKRAEKELD
jgi:Sulfotransferase family